MEFALLLGSPLAGAAVLGVLGARRFAPELNVTFSLLTFLAAGALTVRVIGAGNLTVAHDQFFIDPFNVFLVAVLVLGIFFFQIREQFDSLDLHHLESLREDGTSGTSQRVE